MSLRSTVAVAAATCVAALAIVVPATTASGDLLSEASLTTTTTVAVSTGDSSLTSTLDESVDLVEESVETVEETVVEPADETLEPIVDVNEDEDPDPAPTATNEDSTSDDTATSDTGGATSGAEQSDKNAAGGGGAASGGPAVVESTPAADVATPAARAAVPALARAVADAAAAARVSAEDARLPLVDADFATGATRPSVAPLLDGAYRSSIPVLDLFGDHRLTPRLVASLLAPFPVAGAARYREIPGATLATISSEAGVPVIASADGSVSGDADQLLLVGPDDTVYVYGGLGRLSTKAADGGRVRKGDVLGFIDNGDFQFSLHPSGGAAVDPVPYLDRWLAEALQRAQSLAASPDAVRALTQVQRSASASAGSRQSAASPAVDTPEVMSLDGAQRIVATTGLPLVGLVALALSAWGRKRWWRNLTAATRV